MTAPMRPLLRDAADAVRTGGIDLGHGMADDGAEALTDLLFSEAVVSLGHALPFCLPYDQG